MEHFCKINDIKVKTILLPDEVYKIASDFHTENHLIGKIPDNINDAIYLDEMNHITKNVTWMIRAVLEENPFEGMDEITIMVLDNNQKVCFVLDHNGIPMNLEK